MLFLYLYININNPNLYLALLQLLDIIKPTTTLDLNLQIYSIIPLIGIFTITDNFNKKYYSTEKKTKSQSNNNLQLNNNKTKTFIFNLVSLFFLIIISYYFFKDFIIRPYIIVGSLISFLGSFLISTYIFDKFKIF